MTTATFTDFVDKSQGAMTTAVDSLSISSGDKVIYVQRGDSIAFGRLQI